MHASLHKRVFINNSLVASLGCTCLLVTEQFAGSIQGHFVPKPSRPTHLDSDGHVNSAHFPTSVPRDHFSRTVWAVTCMLLIFLFIIDILFTYFLSDLDIDSKQVVYICFKILLEE